jgi:hypothetical protein
LGSYEEHSVDVKNLSLLLIPTTRTGRQSEDEIVEQVLARDQRVCQMCGADESCLCPYDGTKVSLFLRSIETPKDAEKLAADHMRTVCSTCADGIRSAFVADSLQNAAPSKLDRLQLLAQIRRATITDQQAVLGWLLQKFKLKVEKV